MVEKYAHYKNKEKRKEYNRKYQQRYMKMYRERRKIKGKPILWHQNHYKRLRSQVIEKLGGKKCIKCGCTAEKILEINHINGKGYEERKNYGNNSQIKFYREIINEKVSLTNYNILCKVCNIQHYVESVLGIKGHFISWNRPL